MANVVVDTSVWVDFLRHGRGPAAEALDLLLAERRVVLCGIVELELLQGERPGERGKLEDLLAALPFLETERNDYRKAGALLGELRTKGIKVPATDGLIAALCLRHGLPLLTLDKHFAHFKGLELRAS